MPEVWCHVTCTKPLEKRFYYLGGKRFLLCDGHWMMNNKKPIVEQEWICCLNLLQWGRAEARGPGRGMG